jgi:cell wall-associated NlpC family hydrolase
MFITACQSPNASSISAAQNLTTNSPTRHEQKMISYARSFIGTKYVWGGSTPKGFDCSGFIHYIYNNYSIKIPRTTSEYPQLFTKSVTLKDAQVGDLIVFTGANPSIRKPGHAGIISEIKNDSIKFVHSSSSQKHFGVTETNYYKSGYPKRFLTVVRM